MPEFFPANSTEALAYLYVQNQDIKGKTPAELHTMFQEAYYAIQADFVKKQMDGWFSTREEALKPEVRWL